MGGGPLRFGVVGVGLMGREHLRNLALLPEVEVVAYADPHEPSRRWAALAAPAARAYETLEAMLRRERLDALVVATPNHTHRAVLEELLGRPVHLLVEKPLCTTVEDARWVLERARRHPGIVAVGMEYRYMPPIAVALERLRAGAAGRIVLVSVRERRFPFLPKVGNWNRFSRYTGGTLVEKCCHFFDLMRLVVGADPVRVLASGGQDVNHLDERIGGERPDILDNALAIVDFANGARGALELAMFAEAARNHQELSAIGDEGSVECYVTERAVFVGRRHPRSLERIDVPPEPELEAAGSHLGATYYELAAFVRSIREGRPPEVGVEDGFWAVATGVAAERAARERRAVELREVLG